MVGEPFEGHVVCTFVFSVIGRAEEELHGCIG